MKMLELTWVRDHEDTNLVSDEIKEELEADNERIKKKHGAK